MKNYNNLHSEEELEEVENNLEIEVMMICKSYLTRNDHILLFLLLYTIFIFLFYFKNKFIQLIFKKRVTRELILIFGFLKTSYSKNILKS